MSVFVKGRDFLLYFFIDDENKGFSCLTDCAFEINTKAIKLTAKSVGKWAAYDYTFTGWTATASAIFKNVPLAGTSGPWDVTSMQLNEMRPTILFTLTDGNGYVRHAAGRLVIEKCTYSGGADGFAVFDIAMRGSGPIELSDIGIPGGIFVQQFVEQFV